MRRRSLPRNATHLDKGQAIIAALDMKQDWEKRVRALHDVTAYVSGQNEEAQIDFLQNLRQPLKENILDRRSAVCKDACECVAHLAKMQLKAFLPLASYYIQDLINGTSGSIKVMAIATLTCAEVLVDECHSYKLLPAICETLLNSKSAKLRQTSGALLLKVVQTWHVQTFQSMWKEIETALIRGSEDAIGETRTLCRQAVVEYLDKMPARFDALMQGLPAQVRQKLSSDSNVLRHPMKPPSGRVMAAAKSVSNRTVITAPSKAVSPDFSRPGFGVPRRDGVQDMRKSSAYPAAGQSLASEAGLQEGQSVLRHPRILPASALRVSVPALKLDRLEAVRTRSDATSIDTFRSGQSSDENRESNSLASNQPLESAAERQSIKSKSGSLRGANRPTLHASALRVSVPALKLEAVRPSSKFPAVLNLDSPSSFRSGQSSVEQASNAQQLQQDVSQNLPITPRHLKYTIPAGHTKLHQSAIRVTTNIKLKGQRQDSPPGVEMPKMPKTTLPKHMLAQRLNVSASSVSPMHRSVTNLPSMMPLKSAIKQPRFAPMRQSTMGSLGGQGLRQSTTSLVSRTPVQRHRRTSDNGVGLFLLDLKKGFTKWQEKLLALEKISELIENTPLVIANPRNADLFADALVTFTSDPHAKVAGGALAQMLAILKALPEFWSGHKVLTAIPALLLRLADTRESVRNLADEATESFAYQLGLATILPGLTKTLHTSKVARIVSAALSVFSTLFEKLSEEDHQPEPAHLRHFLKQLKVLETDKNSEIRFLALEAICLISPPQQHRIESPGRHHSLPSLPVTAAHHTLTKRTSPEKMLAKPSPLSRTSSKLRSVTSLESPVLNWNAKVQSYASMSEAPVPKDCHLQPADLQESDYLPHSEPQQDAELYREDTSATQDVRSIQPAEPELRLDDHYAQEWQSKEPGSQSNLKETEVQTKEHRSPVLPSPTGFTSSSVHANFGGTSLADRVHLGSEIAAQSSENSSLAEFSNENAGVQTPQSNSRMPLQPIEPRRQNQIPSVSRSGKLKIQKRNALPDLTMEQGNGGARDIITKGSAASANDADALAQQLAFVAIRDTGSEEAKDQSSDISNLQHEATDMSEALERPIAQLRNGPAALQDHAGEQSASECNDEHIHRLNRHESFSQSEVARGVPEKQSSKAPNASCKEQRLMENESAADMTASSLGVEQTPDQDKAERHKSSAIPHAEVRSQIDYAQPTVRCTPEITDGPWCDLQRAVEGLPLQSARESVDQLLSHPEGLISAASLPNSSQLFDTLIHPNMYSLIQTRDWAIDLLIHLGAKDRTVLWQWITEKLRESSQEALPTACLCLLATNKLLLAIPWGVGQAEQQACVEALAPHLSAKDPVVRKLSVDCFASAMHSADQQLCSTIENMVTGTQLRLIRINLEKRSACSL